LRSARVDYFAAIASTCKLGGKTFKLKECGSRNNSCCALTFETGLFGDTDDDLAPFLRRLAAWSCLSTMKTVLERQLQPKLGESGSTTYGFVASQFVFERDAHQYLQDMVSELECARKPGEGFGVIALNALAERMGIEVKYRIPFKDSDAKDGDDNWWTYTPSWTAPAFVGVTLMLYHTGGWHWKFAHEVCWCLCKRNGMRRRRRPAVWYGDTFT